jgi:hypothetical protein
VQRASLSLSGWEITQQAPILSFVQQPVYSQKLISWHRAFWVDPFASGYEAQKGPERKMVKKLKAGEQNRKRAN